MAIRVTWYSRGIYTIIMDRVELAEFEEIVAKQAPKFSSNVMRELIAGGLGLLKSVYYKKESEVKDGAGVSEASADTNAG